MALVAMLRPARVLGLRWSQFGQLVELADLRRSELAMLAARQIASELQGSELHLDHATHGEPSAFEKSPNGRATMRARRFDAKPAIGALAADVFDPLELDRFIVVSHESRQRRSIELRIGDQHAGHICGWNRF